MIQTNGRCYEDFEVGLVMRHVVGRTITGDVTDLMQQETTWPPADMSKYIAAND